MDWTLSGRVPIEQVEVGEIVITFDEETKLPIVGTVTDLIVTEGTALLELTVRHVSGRLETIETTDEHPFWREADGDAAEGWARADALSPGDRVRTLSGSAIVESVRFGSERTTVYNLSVSTDPSYLIGDDGVWVHNCRILVRNFNDGMSEALTFLTKRGYGQLSQPVLGKFGPNKGKPTGMMSADGKAKYRIEYDGSNGFHINVQSGKEKGPHIVIEGKSEADMMATLRQLFPDSYP